MARILISFLGTGAVNDDRSYKTAKYRFADSDKDYDRPFVAAAISEKYQADKVFLLGTVHSMWDGVYDYFGHENRTYNDSVWEEIYEHCNNANYQSPLELPHKAEIEAALGTGSQVVLLKYGLNADEIKYNSEAILGLSEYINKGDEIIVDITHSFRSLPMYAMNLLIYLRNVRGVQISHICYGMLEMNSEPKYSYSPVVELKELLTVNDWITGAYSMLEFGNAYKIAELLRSINSQISGKLKDFSDIKNLNHLNALEKQCNELAKMGGIGRLPQIAQMVVKPVIGDFLKWVRPRPTDDPKYQHSLFQCRLARWHCEKRNYLASYISLNEAIISFVCEKAEVSDPLDFDTREAVKAELKKIRKTNESLNELYELAQMSGNVSFRRDVLAHNVKGRMPTSHGMINDLKNYLHQIYGMYPQFNNAD